jgi:hypothetical protein
MAKPNYNFAKRQKEAARKARQDARLARRQSKPESGVPAADDAGAPPPGGPKPGPTA